jgi:serine/threonine protein kinase
VPYQTQTTFGPSAGEALVQYEKQLSAGTIGSLWLGRLASGTESGRLITVRRIPTHLFDVSELDRVMHIAGVVSRLKSPSLVKLLGAIREETEFLCVSEYLAGVRMVDLQRFVIEGDNPIPTSVAVRLILEITRASVAAHRLMSGLGILTTQRVIFGDAVLIALFGEALLTDVGILSDLLRCSRVSTIAELAADLAPEEIQGTSSNCGSPEVFTLGVWLWELLTSRWLFPRQLDVESCRRAVTNKPISRIDAIERVGMPVPEPLVRLLDQALMRDPRKRIGSLEGLIDALEQLPSQCVASSEQLGAWIRGVAPQILPGNDTSAIWPLEAEQVREFTKSDPPMQLGPPDSYNWDPPTFAERQLVATVFGITKVAESPRQALPAVFAVSIPVSQRVPPKQRRWVIAAAVGAVALVLGMASSLLFLRKSPNAEHARATVEPTQASAQPADIAPTAMLGASAPESSRVEANNGEPADNESTRARGKTKTLGPAPFKPASKVVEPTPRPEVSVNGSYHPNKIAPFRPKGI